jgi:hypothetical protein
MPKNNQNSFPNPYVNQYMQKDDQVSQNSKKSKSSFQINLHEELKSNPNFISDLLLFDQGMISANDFFMKNLSVFKKVYDFTISNSIDIKSLKNDQITAIIITLYHLS